MWSQYIAQYSHFTMCVIWSKVKKDNGKFNRRMLKLCLPAWIKMYLYLRNFPQAIIGMQDHKACHKVQYIIQISEFEEVYFCYSTCLNELVYFKGFWLKIKKIAWSQFPMYFIHFKLRNIIFPIFFLAKKKPLHPPTWHQFSKLLSKLFSSVHGKKQDWTIFFILSPITFYKLSI